MADNQNAKKRVRTIITTDMECDDMNSMIHLCLYLNEIELDGIVYTSSQFHFNGDGQRTQAQANANYRCQGGLPVGPDPEAGKLTSYRPFEEGWIESLFDHEYREAYPHLLANAEGFPDPDEILSKIYYGNIAFEGDVQFETDGSRYIEKCIMDERTDTLYLQSWGGANTIVRALMSIREKYEKTPEWEQIVKKVVDKIAILGVFGGYGQDNSFLDHCIPEVYPGIRCLLTDHSYFSFMSAKYSQSDLKPLLQADYMYPHFKTGHGSLMAKYGLYGDGTVYKGEFDFCQYGLITRLPFNGPDGKPIEFERYDGLGEGDSATYMPLIDFGLRGLENYHYGTILGLIHVDDMASRDQGMPPMGQHMKANPFIRAYHEDFAARAEWCVKDYNECNHNPLVKVPLDVYAKAGTGLTLTAEVEDIRPYQSSWEYYPEGSVYTGGDTPDILQQSRTLEFTVPADAKSGDYFNLVFRAKNADSNPMTGFGKTIVHVI